ncbi:pseudaminic acid synthase [Chitinivibrio alkaliphilus]|uniref:Pseudaminic acid synthase n=1 Tax=Chitinivibrio alkaliphilus ACht1 TaxID=1313304 RepID=U7D5J9_9BACT|nr:pseudaminic acid synthase [Chitinivibrio alkaliphilus]ERP30821.1 pseudaminic acid synthase [Chitinivibrio alkaliphilus ACht1]
MNTPKTYIIAELSANHGGDITIAKETIRAAKESGADAVKVQTYTADTLTIDCTADCFQIHQGTAWDGKTLYELYKEAYMPWEWQPILKKYAQSLQIPLFSSPFDTTAVDFLDAMNVPMYKIASFEITDIPLIEYTAAKKKPILISTGIATKEEIGAAVEACRRMENNAITLLMCTSQYPAKPEDANLATMVDMKHRFNVTVGLSDHTTGWEVACTAVALGATVVEKHFILDPAMGGPDASFSMAPTDFATMVEQIRLVEKIYGTVTYEMTEQKLKNRHFSRSLFVVADMAAGDIFTTENIRSIRPGTGLSPKYLPELLGKKATTAIPRGTPLSWNHIAPPLPSCASGDDQG